MSEPGQNPYSPPRATESPRPSPGRSPRGMAIIATVVTASAALLVSSQILMAPQNRTAKNFAVLAASIVGTVYLIHREFLARRDSLPADDF